MGAVMLITSSKEQQITALTVLERNCLCAILAVRQDSEKSDAMGLETPLTHGWSTASQKRYRNKEGVHLYIAWTDICTSLQGKEDKPCPW